MTRFLYQAQGDPATVGVNKDTERLFAYHQATKHTYDSVRANAHFLDWRNQPNPFRTYEGAPLIALPAAPSLPEIGAFAAMAALGGELTENNGGTPDSREEIRFDAAWLSRLLWHSMAVSAWKKVPRTEDRYSLRVNPSSGNLHPTETYLAIRDFSGLDDGLYHYRADRHALELRRGGNCVGEIARALDAPWAAESRLIVALTSIFWREAWKYRDRAYRYSCHDLGHAMIGLLVAARALGVSGSVAAHFSDLRLARTLGLRQDSDEAPMAFLIFPPPRNTQVKRVASNPLHDAAGIPNELSAEEVSYELLLGMHRSTMLLDPPGPLPRIPESDATTALAEAALPADAASQPPRDASLGATVRRRRSALDFDPRTDSMERADFEQLLDFATRDWRADWRGNFGAAEEARPASRGADFVSLYLYVHRVRNCEPGVYRWHAARRELEQLHSGNVERIAAFLSLEQPLAGNACFAVSMIADLARAARVFGNRGYRYAHFEAGAIGQRLYVGAEALGWNATGIGAFYDDDVHRYLGFLGEEATSADARTLPRQVIYHFAVGRAVPDPRIEA
ncbi:MAG: SagB/ThcOx family dehydrogenase [Candidatus Acidiferrales bacterium]